MSPDSIPPPTLRPPGEKERREKRRKLVRLALLFLVPLTALTVFRVLCVQPDLDEVVHSSRAPGRQDSATRNDSFLGESSLAEEDAQKPPVSTASPEEQVALQGGADVRSLSRTSENEGTPPSQSDPNSTAPSSRPESYRNESALSPRSSLHGFSGPSGSTNSSSQEDSRDGSSGEAPATASGSTGEINVSPEELDQGILKNMESLYQSQCAICHGEKGEGDGPYASMYGPMESFAERSYWFSFNTEEGAKIILGGTPPGKPGPRMPGFYGQLTESDVYDMIKYLQTLERQEEPENPDAGKKP